MAVEQVPEKAAHFPKKNITFENSPIRARRLFKSGDISTYSMEVKERIPDAASVNRACKVEC